MWKQKHLTLHSKILKLKSSVFNVFIFLLEALHSKILKLKC